MSWLRIDDEFTDHPKVIGLSLAARGLWVTGLVYSGRRLTDGIIPSAVVTRENDPDSAKACAELCAVGLWTRHNTDYEIHDYLKYNPSRDDVEKQRGAKVEAGRAGGIASAQARATAHGQAESKQVGKQNPTPVPVNPLTHKETINLAEFENWWTNYPRKIKKQYTLSKWKLLTNEERARAVEQLPAWVLYYEGKAEEFIPHPSTWLNQKYFADDPPKATSPNGHANGTSAYVHPSQWNTEGTM